MNTPDDVARSGNGVGILDDMKLGGAKPSAINIVVGDLFQLHRFLRGCWWKNSSGDSRFKCVSFTHDFNRTNKFPDTTTGAACITDVTLDKCVNTPRFYPSMDTDVITFIRGNLNDAYT
ncbi:hypothetical protein Y032_0026g1307 [Ancylostoma ceylanicum]|uniref:Uncharacterized protein n=1 Tax=Ancylostoma ceylanicum TaxID=53326 RepID=A0A016UU26_9BILA|nr:hypothetical protein Y032_0026g1307 [Ancylostoma ceylanicum]